MDEMQLLEDFRATVAPPDEQVLARARSRMLTGTPVRSGWSAGRAGSPARPGRRTKLAVSGAAIAAIATTLSVVLPGGADGTFATKAWAVERNPDGTVTVTIDQQFQDPAGLQHALQEDGITAWVQVNAMATGPEGTGAACAYTHLKQAPSAVQRAVVTTNLIQEAADGSSPVKLPTGHPDAAELVSWTIHPSAMPAGSSILFADWLGTMASLLKSPTVLTTAAAPVCVPPPAHARSRVG
ncbi:MAG TPA: hypothetical protein VHZ33_09560 [Trebonia sp.]|jgi:hypothetical protein|nr:hypothetical protein [Trebonia sp.]